MMESTPSLVNWHDVNKLPKPKMQTLSSLQAVATVQTVFSIFNGEKAEAVTKNFTAPLLTIAAAKTQGYLKRLLKQVLY